MNRVSKVIFAAIFVICSAGYCSASDIYVAQSSAGGNTGADCADARALSTLASSDWVAGNTIHLCGTITFPAGSAGLVAQGSGTSGSPIIVQFETNAILEAPYFGGGGSCGSPSSCKAGIELYGYNYIIVDGGTNGIVENTANGSDLGNQQTSAGVAVYGNNIIVRNLTVENIYINDPTTLDEAGVATVDVVAAPGTANFILCNNTLRSARAAVTSAGLGATAPVYPLPSCSSNTFLSGQNYFGNMLYDLVWGFQFDPSVSSSATYNVFNNDVNLGTNWVLSNNFYHTDGIIAYDSGSAGQVIIYVFNNYFHGVFSGTGQVFCEDNGGTTGCSAYIFNNLFVQDASAPAGNNRPLWLLTTPSPNTDGPDYVYNNTFVGYAYEAMLGPDSGPIITFENNLTTTGATNLFYVKGYGTNLLPTIISTSDYNGFYGGAGKSFKGGGQTFWCWPQNGGSPSSCTGGNGPWVNTGFDTHSVSANPNLNASYQLSSGSPDIGAGANLSSRCGTPGLGPLCYDKNGIARPSTGAWDIGTYEAPRPNPPVGLAGTVK